MTEKITYYKDRDFSETFNISVKFIRENFKLLLMSITFIAGPFILLSAISTALYENSLSGAATNMIRDGRFRFFELVNYQYAISFIAKSLANLAMTAVVFEVMKLYRQMPSGSITVSMITRELLRDLVRLLGTMMTFYLLILGILIICGGIAIGFSSAHWGFAIIAIIVVVVAVLLVTPNILYLVSTTYLIRIFDGLPIMESIAKARHAMKNNYWWTWLLMLCLFLIVMMIGIALAVPAGVLTGILGMTHINIIEYAEVFMVLKVFSYTFNLILTSFIFVVIGFHYFSTIEAKEGTGLMARIDEIGKKQIHQFEQEY